MAETMIGRLRKRCKADKKRGLTQTQVAVMVLGVNPATLANWLHERTRIAGRNNEARVERYVTGGLETLVDEALRQVKEGGAI
jgi:hypothetical protein